jgi:hypothetical protein
MREKPVVIVATALTACLAVACGHSGSAGPGPSAVSRDVQGSPADSGPAQGAASEAPSWGPEKPPFNLQAVLRPVGDAGFGLVKFRQPNDADRIVYLDVWVRDLAPSTDYSLQRAVDFTVDGNCTSSGWLTLGRGLQPQPITTDLSGTGRASLFRDLGAFATGSRFDIHFQVIDAATSTPVLASGCYEFVVSQ